MFEKFVTIASWIWDRIDIHAMRSLWTRGKHGWPAWTYRAASRIAREDGRLARFMGKIRPCKLCGRGNDQRHICRYGEFWTHVDCAAEYSDACRVDPTTQDIDESDGDYEVRMKQWDIINGYDEEPF